jgi:hypothetical protein
MVTTAGLASRAWVIEITFSSEFMHSPLRQASSRHTAARSLQAEFIVDRVEVLACHRTVIALRAGECKSVFEASPGSE